MKYNISIIYHSGYGHTARMAQAVQAGAAGVADVEARLFAVEDLEDNAENWAELDSAHAMIFGCPTYMGSVSAGMKRFMEATSSRWMEMKWADKLAAGFTNSGSQNGDKQNALVSLATLAAQHGMVWINLNIPPGNNSSGGRESDLNRLGASLGAMAQSNIDVGPEDAPPTADLETARLLGERVAVCAKRWG